MATSVSATTAELSWTNPPAGQTGSIVRRAEGSNPPSGPGEGTLVANLGFATSVTDVGLVPSTTYSYAVFVEGADDYYSSAATVTITTDAAAPAPVTGLQASSQTATTVSLSWVNPPVNFTGAMVRRALGTTPPANVTAGVLVADVPGPASSVIDTGLSASTTYSYAVFAHEATPLYATAATVTITTANNTAPAAPVLNSPANGGSVAGTTATLVVTVSDPDADLLTVTYFGRPFASGTFAQIDQNSNVPPGVDTASWSNLGSGQTHEWYVTVSDGTAVTTGPTWTFHTTSADPVLVGSGDIASCAVADIEDTATGNLILGIDGIVFTTGDNVYPNGTEDDFDECYDPTPWGSAGAKDRTRPVPGNHDWGSGEEDSLDGYFGYYGANANEGGTSYYSYDVPSSNWHVVNLDTQCQLVPGGCGAGSAQDLWLEADLAANSTKNVIAVWHKPRYSSGASNNPSLQPLWDDLYLAGVDIVLQGHDHFYERFAPMKSGATPSSPPVADPTYGIRQFTVGTGGYSNVSAGPPLSTSEALDDETFGVLKLTLHATTYDWLFLPIAGSTFTDSGTGTVHDAPP